jgi:peroxiredoxin
MAPFATLALLVPLLAPAAAALPPQPPPSTCTAAVDEHFRALLAEYHAAVALLERMTTSPSASTADLDRAFNARMRPLVDAGHGPSIAWTLRHFVPLASDELGPDELRRELWSRLLPAFAAEEWIWSREFDVLGTLLAHRSLLGPRPCAELAATVLAAQPLEQHDRRLRALTAQSDALAPLGEPDRAAREAAASLWRREFQRAPKGALASHCERALWRLENIVIGASLPPLVSFDVDGNQLSVSDFRGKVLVLGFFSLASEQGRRDAQAFAQLDAQFEGPSLAVLGIGGGVQPDEFRRRADECGLRLPTAYEGGARGSVMGALRLDRAPLALVLDRDGRLRHVVHTLAELEPAYSDALRDPAMGGSGAESMGNLRR